MWGYLDKFLEDPLRMEFRNADEICTLISHLANMIIFRLTTDQLLVWNF